MAIREKGEELQISLENRYFAITEDEALGAQGINDNLNNIIKECPVEVRVGQMYIIPSSSLMR